jgi:hypothetical protein
MTCRGGDARLPVRLRFQEPTSKILGAKRLCLGALRLGSRSVRDIDEAYTLSLERRPTWRIWVPLNARKLTFFASSRYVLYLESTISFVNMILH